MRIRISISAYFSIYFVLLLILYHYKIKEYFYWDYIALLKDAEFDFSLSRFILAVGIFILNLYVISRTNRGKIIFTVLSVFFALLTIPSLVAFTSKNMYPFALMIYHQLFFYLLFFLSKVKLDFSRIPALNKNQALYLLFAITTLGIIPYLIVYGPHINLKNLALMEVYETRLAILEYSNPYFGYTYSAFTKIVIPVLILFSLELKNRITLIFSVLYLILFYLFGAHKTVYLSLIIILLFYWTSYFRAAYLLLRYSILLIGFALILALFNFDYLWILTVRRVHFIPTLLDICYLDFFQDQYIYWSESVLRSVLDYPFDSNHAKLIGSAYFKNPNMAANNGMVSDGFMNAGSIGVALNVLLVSLYFMILNSLKVPSKYFGLYFLIIFSFISSSLTTVFLTHGAIVLLLISIFILNAPKTESVPSDLGTYKE